MISVLDRFGQTGRGIQNQMYGAQFDAAKQMAMEPYKRMQMYQNMLQPMLPKGSYTRYGTQAGGGVADLLRMFGMI
jgi:glycerate kinase